MDELAVAGGEGTIGTPASGPALEPLGGAWSAGASAGSRLFEAAFQGLDELDGSAGWVELPVPANVATPAMPNTANTTVAAITTRTGESARRNVAGRASLALPLPKPRRSSGVEPRSPKGRWWDSSPRRVPNGSLMRSCLHRSPRTSPQAGRRSGVRRLLSKTRAKAGLDPSSPEIFSSAAGTTRRFTTGRGWRRRQSVGSCGSSSPRT